MLKGCCKFFKPPDVVVESLKPQSFRQLCLPTSTPHSTEFYEVFCGSGGSFPTQRLHIFCWQPTLQTFGKWCHQSVTLKVKVNFEIHIFELHYKTFLTGIKIILNLLRSRRSLLTFSKHKNANMIGHLICIRYVYWDHSIVFISMISFYDVIFLLSCILSGLLCLICTS